MQPQNSQHATTGPQGSEVEQDPDFGPAIAELERAAGKKQVNGEAAEADLQRCFKAYRDGYPVSDTSPTAVGAAEWFKERQNERQSVADAKPHLKKMADNLATLSNQIDKMLRENQMYHLLWFTAGAYEKLPAVKAKLDEHNKTIGEDLKASGFEDPDEYRDALAATHWSGIDILGHDLAMLRRAADVMCDRLKAVSGVRAPKASKKPIRLRRYVIELSEVYFKHSGKKARAGNQGGKGRNDAPFVRFVIAVLMQHDPEEAKRKALGQSIYDWLALEAKYQSLLIGLEELER